MAYAVSKTVSAAAVLSSLVVAVGAAQADEAKTLSVWDQQTNVTSSKLLRDASDRFEHENPGYKVENSHILNDAYKTKLKVAFGANQPPCVFESWGGGTLHEYVKAGQIVDLTPYLQKDPAYRGRFLPASWKAVTFDGKTYGVAAENASAAVIFYNKDIFQQYGLTPPATWDELMHVVQVLTSHNIAPFALSNKNKWTGSMYYMYLVDRIGGPDVVRDAVERRPGPGFAGPAFVEAGKYVQQLVKAGAFAQGYNGLDYDVGASRRLLYSGRAAMELMGGWEASTIQNENPAFSKKLDFFPFPSVPGGKGDPRDVIGTVGDGFLSISTECKSPDAAFKLIQSLTDDDSMRARVVDRKIPPVKNAVVDDPFLKRLQDLIVKAPSVQLWYDQALPPRLGELHKDTTQALFGLSLTPEAAAQQMEAAAKAGS
ncbi:extracellular solute-binding protein [Paraburkholderia caballeronis]|uniref:extracellular solute-binding protein n=1 Tax=Paraburkholderia caballeronis TaxID=416943 RepID=UPI001066F40A|nr:extracellular solute-binding protein [Paraburkholderia caballeronis]TDV16432.1 carbohydrate ABC transporter substrate-binding protein (CUT1 family) [Paraburkholderia caballeronis]TDV18828.1 carbohydrate ABC transporter substrate-binding protein (CUT1 family) [Paraburkholderia caballeronis]TDV26961.1 carbohydrate ABC transporter substrate-binding protein (CUT1 family) [Paraburkholderia caballeronis]